MKKDTFERKRKQNGSTSEKSVNRMHAHFVTHFSLCNLELFYFLFFAKLDEECL